MNVALVYDRVNKIGGAERVLAVLHKIYPKAPLFTAVYHPQKAAWAKGWDVRPSFLNHFPLARSTHELYPWLTPLAFESFDFTNFDLVISVTSAEAKGILTKPSTLHICYCLTPTRYLWIDADIYQERIPESVRSLSKPVFSYLRSWDRIASQRPDFMIAISKTVQRRIKKHYAQDAEVVYPPVDVERFKQKKTSHKAPPADNYFLVVSRLVPYKRLDLVIDACNLLRAPLIIIGTGMEAKKLKSRAGSTVHFVGRLTDQDLILYYQRSRALISPQEEDFGISIVEAQAAGKPVIAFNRGGATEIIRTGKTGIFFSRQTAASLIRAMQKFERLNFNARDCQDNAKLFSQERFTKQFIIKMEEMWEKYKKRAVIFAGGVGTRMWPLSRKSTPKQFEKIVGNKSTLQLAAERIKPVFGWDSIFISTGSQYAPIVREQLPEIPQENIIGEPEMRDVAAAVGYVMAILAKTGPDGPVAIIWSDHLMERVKTFQRILRIGCKYIAAHKKTILLIGQKPRFASQNLGWIEFGKLKETVNGFKIHEFKSWHYRPKLQRAREYFQTENFAWNPGYFIVTPRFVLDQFRKLKPEMYQGLCKLQASFGTSAHEKELKKIYPKFEKISFDDAILEKVKPCEAVVLAADLGWSDIGAWEALKEVLQQKKGESVVKGNVVLRNTEDSIAFSYTDQLLTVINMKGLVIVVTNDVILVCPQESVPEIKKQLKEFEGTEFERFS